MTDPQLPRIIVAASPNHPALSTTLAAIEAAGHRADLLGFDPGRSAPPLDWTALKAAWAGCAPLPPAELLRSSQRIASACERLSAAIAAADALVLLLPAGAGAHLAAGYAIGRGQRVLVAIDGRDPVPSPLYLLAARVVDLAELPAALQDARPAPAEGPADAA